MSARANPVVVGGFVVGALVLLVAGVLLFGSGALLREQITVVAFFSGNVRGLQEGSPVEFRGVRVGTVTKVQLALDVDSMDLLIPVYMELEPRSLTVGGETAAQRSAGALPFLDSLVERGLRARLDLKSFVTGQLAVGLDMYPDSTIERVGAIGDVYEVPTVPSTLDRVAAILQELPLQDIAVKLIDSLDGLSRLLTEGNLDITLRETAATAADTRALVAELRSGVGPLLEHVDATVRELRAALGAVAQKTDVTLDDYRQLAQHAGTRLDTVASRLEIALDDLAGLRQTVDARVAPVADAAIETLEDIDELVAADSRTRYNLDEALESLAAAARSLRVMADYLAQNPDALIRGRIP